MESAKNCNSLPPNFFYTLLSFLHQVIKLWDYHRHYFTIGLIFTTGIIYYRRYFTIGTIWDYYRCCFTFYCNSLEKFTCSGKEVFAKAVEAARNRKIDAGNIYIQSPPNPKYLLHEAVKAHLSVGVLGTSILDFVPFRNSILIKSMTLPALPDWSALSA